MSSFGSVCLIQLGTFPPRANDVKCRTCEGGAEACSRVYRFFSQGWVYNFWSLHSSPLVVHPACLDHGDSAEKCGIREEYGDF